MKPDVSVTQPRDFSMASLSERRRYLRIEMALLASGLDQGYTDVSLEDLRLFERQLSENGMPFEAMRVRRWLGCA